MRRGGRGEGRMGEGGKGGGGGGREEEEEEGMKQKMSVKGEREI